MDSPPYTQSSPAPSYSPEPLENEERLEYTLRPRRRVTPTGQFTKSSGYITLALNEQESGASTPIYCQNGLVNGTISISNCNKVFAVVLRLECNLRLANSEGSSNSTTIMSDKYTLWKSSRSEPCPKDHSFACVFPSVYKAKKRTRSLPPSYEIALSGGFGARCLYTLSVIISKTSSRIPFFGTSQMLTVNLEYRPRSRPSRPILPCGSLLSTIKPDPEEWYQILSIMPVRHNSGLQPIVCNLFIPSAQTYGILDTIPLHVQLSGPLSSLRALFPYSPPSSPSHSSRRSFTNSDFNTMSLRVFLSREVTVEVFGQITRRTSVLGEAILVALPPVASTLNREEGVLDWEGAVRCADNISSGGFFTHHLTVRDSIVLSLVPPHPLTSPLVMHRHVHPIKLVTDSWTDLTGHPQDR